MLAEIDKLPRQLISAWELGQRQPQPWGGFEAPQGSIRHVILSGMGGSAIGADLLAAYVASLCRLPVFVSRDYGLPAWAHGPETLVIATSHTGNTEETLDAFDAARQAGCRVLAICTGGELEQRAVAGSLPLWKFDHTGQPRAAVGFSFGLILAAFYRLGFLDESAEKTAESVSIAMGEMNNQQEALRASIPVVKNPAKRLAGQLVGRWVNVYGSGILAPVARRWKGQLNELAKAGAGFEFLPEADHNALAGLVYPMDIQTHTMTVFLRSPSDHPRNNLRADLTRHNFMVEGLNTDVYDAQEAMQKVKQIMVKLKLTLHPTKTRIANMNREGFDFLGFHFHKRKSKTHKLVPYMWPSQKAMKAVRKKIHEITERKRLSEMSQELIQYLNPVIRGWRNYFRCGNSSEKLKQLDIYVWQRLRRWARLRKGSGGHWNRSVFETWVAQSGLEYFYRSGICVNT